MKGAKKSKMIKEPTLTNVMSAVQDLTEAVQVGFAKVEDRFDDVEQGLDGVENRLGSVEYRMTALENRTGSLEDGVEDIKETLGGIARATDKDAVAIINHERRIRHLEKAQA